MDKNARLTGMEFDVWHNRPLKPGGLQTSPGGYEVMLGDGRTYGFDFVYSEGSIDEEDPHIAHYYVHELDTTTFPKSVELTRGALTDYMFTEFYIDTEGYEDERILVCPLEETVSFIFEDE